MRYTFQCKKCLHVFDLTMSLREYIDKQWAFAINCPKCEFSTLKRIYEASDVIIKYIGDGFTKSVKEEK